MYNLSVIMKKPKTTPNWETFDKITELLILFQSVKVKKKKKSEGRLKAQWMVTTMGYWAWKKSLVLWKRGWGPNWAEPRTGAWGTCIVGKFCLTAGWKGYLSTPRAERRVTFRLGGRCQAQGNMAEVQFDACVSRQVILPLWAPFSSTEQERYAHLI